MRVSKLPTTIVAIGAALLLTAACGSGSTDGGAGPDTSPEALATVQAEYDKAIDVGSLELPMPSEPVDPGSRRVAIISVGSNSTSGVLLHSLLLRAVKDIGWDYDEFDGQLNLSAVGNYIQQAVQRDYDAIIYTAYAAESLKAPIQAALDAGVPVAGFLSTPDEFGDRLITTNDDQVEAGERAAQAMIVNSEGKAKIQVFYDKAFVNNVERAESAEAYVKKHCSGCQIDMQEVNTADLAQPGPPYLNAFISTHPKGTVTDILTTTDSHTDVFMKSLAQAGRTDIRLNGFDGIPFGIEGMTESKYNVPALTSQAWLYQAYGLFDQLARKLAKQPLWSGLDAVPVGLIDKTNVDGFDTDGTFPGSDKYIDGFLTLWGKK